LKIGDLISIPKSVLIHDLFSFSEIKGLDGYTCVSPLSVDEKHLTMLIEIIHKATFCDDWKTWILKDKDENKRFPPFLRAFYNLTSKDDEDVTRVNTYLETMLQHVAPQHLRSLRETNAKTTSENVARYKEWSDLISDTDLNNKFSCNAYGKDEKTKMNFNLATEFIVPGDKNPISLNDLSQTADSFTEETSWSVLSLFYHPGICEVPNVRCNKKRFAFWPTCAPKVNNRAVDYKILINSEEQCMITEFTENFETSWVTQGARIVPYCVTSESGKSAVKLGPVIGTTGNTSQMHDNNGNQMDDSDCFAGNLFAEKITYKEVEKLYFALVGETFEDSTMFGICKEMNDDDRAMLGLKVCLDYIKSPNTYNSLKTPQDWCNLYLRLWVKGAAPIEMGEFPFHPTNMNDLVHKTRMLFLSQHAVRFSFLEGQKRSIASTYGLIGFLPQQRFVFHGDLDPKEFTIGDDENFFNKANDYCNLSKVKASEDNCKATFANGGKMITSTVLNLKTNGPFTMETMKVFQAFSKCLVLESNKEEGRSWVHAVEALTEHIDIMKHLSMFNHVEDWSQKQKQEAFMRRFRITFFETIFKQEMASKVFLKDCAFMPEVSKALLLKDMDSFVDLCLFKKTKAKSGKKMKEKDYRGKIYATYLDFKHIPTPKMVHSLCMLFVSVAFGSKTGLISLKNVAALKGKRSTANHFRNGFEFFPEEVNYTSAVSLIRN
jgi:hypothetical protein